MIHIKRTHKSSKIEIFNLNSSLLSDSFTYNKLLDDNEYWFGKTKETEMQFYVKGVLIGEPFIENEKIYEKAIILQICKDGKEVAVEFAKEEDWRDDK